MTLQDLIKSQRDIPFKDGEARNNDLGIFPIELFYYHDSNVQKSAESWCTELIIPPNPLVTQI